LILCPYCKKRNTRGAGVDGDAYGHRVAHCVNRAGRARRGYVLVPAPEEGKPNPKPKKRLATV
jgi:hypothetical protein